MFSSDIASEVSRSGPGPAE